MTTYFNYLGQAMSVTPNPNIIVYGTSAGGETLTVPDGTNGANGDGGGDTLIGSNGDQTFYISDPRDQVDVASGLTGLKSVVAYTSYTLPANVQNMTVIGDFNFAAGNSRDNLIIVTGQQWVDGNGGNDVFVGGSGNATFQIHANSGSDVIYGWHVGDHIRLLGSGLTTGSAVAAAATQVGSDVVLHVDTNDTLTIRNTTVAQITATTNFFLPLDTHVLGSMTFDDEFNTLNLYDPSTGTGVWQTNFGGNLKDQWAYRLVSNGELQDYVTPDFQGSGGQAFGYQPFSINNGVLSISAAPIPANETQSTYGGTYFSGMINTLGTFQQQYGYFEMRAQMPAVAGAWPAFWLEPSPYTPNIEADITEQLGVTPHVDYVRAYGGNETQYDNAYVPDPTGWHTYGLLWTATGVTFYMDGVAVLQGPTPSTWNQPLALIANLAVGGWGGTPSAAGFPAQLNIDYIHVYALADGSSIVVHPTPTPPAATLQTSGAPTSSTIPADQPTTAVFASSGQPVTTSGIAIGAAKPDPAHLAPGQTFYVWQDSGAVFAAVADGHTLATPTALMAGDVSGFQGAGTWLSDGHVVVTYLETDSGVQNAWALVFDPLTSTFVKQQLGASTGDIHIAAATNGNFVVSWMSASGVQGRAYDAHAYDGYGWYGASESFAGDLVGVNSAGQAITAVSGQPGAAQLYNVVTPANTVPASISIGPNYVYRAESATGTASFAFTVTRSFDTQGVSTVNWAVQGSSVYPFDASEFAGGAFPSGTLTFADGVATQTIAIDVTGDITTQPDQTFTVVINHPTGAALGAAIATGELLPPTTPPAINTTGQVSQATVGAGQVQTVVDDPKGQPIASELATTSGLQTVTQYFDSLGHPFAATVFQDNGGGNALRQDFDGAWTQKDAVLTTGSAANGTLVQYFDGGFHQQSAVYTRIQGAQTTVQAYGATFDQLSAQTTTDLGGGSTMIQQFDANWNQTSATSVRHDANSDITTQTFDAHWNQTSATLVHQDAGGAVTTQNFDAAWHQLSASISQALTNGGSEVQTFDANWVQTSATVVQHPSANQTVTQQFDGTWRQLSADVTTVNAGQTADQQYDGAWNLLGETVTTQLSARASLVQTFDAHASHVAGADRLQVDGQAGVESFAHTPGFPTTYVFHPGDINGDAFASFVTGAANAAAHDVLTFVGYGAGAALTQIDASHWQVGAPGKAAEVFTLAAALSTAAGDVVFH